MIILGVDPGFARVGYGVIDCTMGKIKAIEYGSITTSAEDNLPCRLNKVAMDLEEIINKYDIQVASVEDLFFNTNIKTAIKVAEARGVILYMLAHHNIEVAEYTPLQIKQALVGYGRADKNQIKEMTKKLLGFEHMPKLDDTTDALAIAICHSFSYKYKDKVKEIRKNMDDKIKKKEKNK